MDRVFSVDEISDQFWTPPASAPDLKMNRSASEWAFQMFLQEEAAAVASPLSSDTATSSSKSVGESDVVEINDGSLHRKNPRSKRDVNRKTGGAPLPHGIHSNPAPAAAVKPFDTGSSVPVGSDGYQEFLQSRLNLACAAVALTKAPYVIGQSSAGVADSISVGSADSISATQASETASYCKDTGGPAENPSLPVVRKKVVAQAKQTISGSSREQSYDDEAEDENETTGTTGGTDVKRVRRMLSNRESARRSRRRKQAHLTEIETQVSQLKVENSSLLKRLTNVSQKYNEAAVDNRVLKADVETLRAKVKMAEETVKRVTGMTPLLQAISEISTMRAPAFNGSPSDSADSTVPVHNPTQKLYEPRPPPPPPRVETAGVVEIGSPRNTLRSPTAPMTGANKMGRTPSMQRVASLEHLQKRLCGEINQSTSKCSPDP